jgi:hypothetical protein
MPDIHVFVLLKKDVDGWDRPGRDGTEKGRR